MIELKTKKRGAKMAYNIKDAVERISNYVQRHNGAKPLTKHDKQMISGHILPLITSVPHKQVPHVDTTKQDESQTNESLQGGDES
jgi:hypothetical protein